MQHPMTQTTTENLLISNIGEMGATAGTCSAVGDRETESRRSEEG